MAYGYYTGIVRSSRNGNVTAIKNPAGITSKKDFALELRRNGFRVIGVLTNHEIDRIKNDWHSMWCDEQIKYINVKDYVTQCL